MISRPNNVVTQQNWEVVVKTIDCHFRQVYMKAREALTFKHEHLLICLVVTSVLTYRSLIHIVRKALHGN